MDINVLMVNAVSLANLISPKGPISKNVFCHYLQNITKKKPRLLSLSSLQADKFINSSIAPKIKKFKIKTSYSWEAIKSIIKDPEAFLYALEYETDLVCTSRKLLGEINIISRKSKEKVSTRIIKETFDNGLQKYTIQRRGENLALIDVKRIGDDKLCIDYLTNVVGASRYKNLEQHILQAAVEDSINNGFLPKIIAIPAEVGENQFSRDVMYKMMGADLVHDSYTGFNKVEVAPNKVAEIMKNKSEKGKLFFPETAENLKKLLSSQ